MKNSKKGISLIVLVITIIVIIILAAAVILTMQKSNPIADARTAVEKEDYTEAQNAYNMWLSKVMVKQLDTVAFNGWIAADGITMSTYADTAKGGATGANGKRLSDGYIKSLDTTKDAIDIDKTITVGFATSSNARLNSDVVNNLVSKVTISQLGLPEQVNAIYVVNNKVIGLYKNSTISFLDVGTDTITVDQTTTK